MDCCLGSSSVARKDQKWHLMMQTDGTFVIANAKSGRRIWAQDEAICLEGVEINTRLPTTGDPFVEAILEGL